MRKKRKLHEIEHDFSENLNIDYILSIKHKDRSKTQKNVYQKYMLHSETYIFDIHFFGFSNDLYVLLIEYSQYLDFLKIIPPKPP